MDGTLIIDSDVTDEEALRACPAPVEIISQQQVLAVHTIGFDGFVHCGQIVVARDLAKEVLEIFSALCTMRFPIEKVIPVARFGWSDDESMRVNNSSGFNYRAIAGGENLSHHATGRAIDINPRQNPYIKPNSDGTNLVLPPDAVYDVRQMGTLTADSDAVRIFESRGWEWGGRWTTRLDYHHFQKP